ncbi:hypothetical protein [Streptomyces sp. NPDC101393]|uniref:hypothetical protein n=1 Tax=Streptomyces sp. NPDC101393 TaxID=3366141 RepID=UPI00382067D5
MQRRHRILTTALVVGAATGISYAVRLAAFDVSPSLIIACTLATAACASFTVAWVADWLLVTTHRCKAPGCDFRVRLRGTSAVENRRLQEAAAAHPQHHLT